MSTKAGKPRLSLKQTMVLEVFSTTWALLPRVEGGRPPDYRTVKSLLRHKLLEIRRDARTRNWEYRRAPAGGK